MKMNDLGEKFSDIGYYNKQMSLGMVDKLFFVDRIPNNKNYTFVDFGCADGTLISHLYEIYGDKCSYIGYDASEEMIEFAKTKFQGNPVDNVIFTTSWEEVRLRLPYSSETVLILSSVIHEVYSYAKDAADISTFWERVLKPRFKYIVVRDMMLSSSSVSRESSSEAVKKVEANPTYSKQLGEFEAMWGSIRNNRNLLHFLLKYRWKINWKREVNENYFPILIEEFLTKVESGLGDSSYRLDYFEKFRIKFLEEQIQKDFGITIEDTTHIKAVFILEEIELPF